MGRRKGDGGSVRRASPKRGVLRLPIIHHHSSIINSKGFTLIELLVVVGVITLRPARVRGGPADSAEPAPSLRSRQALIEKGLTGVRDCMAGTPAPWPDEWQREYVDTIRRAVASQQDTPEYAARLEILRRGFRPYWESLRKGPERSLFDVRRAQIRWYVETLMRAELPGEEETQVLRHQYEDLVEHAAGSLLAQFSFLDPNAVQAAKTDHLAECYRNIEAPLLPIFLRPFSETQVDQIKQRWHDLRYARVDLWRQLGGGQATSREDPGTASLQTHPDYLLTQQSLSQLRPYIWGVTAPPPDYYRSAVRDHIDAQRQMLQSRAEARRQERRLPVAVLQTEYISFLLTALLETADCSGQDERE